MAGLYEALAEIHDHEPVLLRLWKKTAGEEHNHAAQFSLLIDAIADSVQSTKVDAQALEGIRRAVENTTEEFRLRSPSPREALVTVIDFEEAMDQVHAHHSLVFSDVRCQRMFKAMMAADAGHVAELRRALGTLGPG